jgi:hypothetical protein
MLQPDKKTNMKQIQLCEPGGISYLSNPPQSKCKNCGQFWFSGSNTPTCRIVEMNTIFPEKSVSPQDYKDIQEEILKQINLLPTQKEILVRKNGREIEYEVVYKNDVRGMLFDFFISKLKDTDRFATERTIKEILKFGFGKDIRGRTWVDIDDIKSLALSKGLTLNDK